MFGTCRPTASASRTSTCGSRSFPVRLLAGRKVSSVLPPAKQPVRAVVQAPVKEVRADISGHYEDRGLHMDVQQYGDLVVARYYGCSHSGILRHGVLTLPTLVDSRGIVLPGGHIKFAGGAHWIKSEKVQQKQQKLQEVDGWRRGLFSSTVSGPRPDALLAAQFNPIGRPDLPSVADIASMRCARQTAATKACFERHLEAIRGLGDALVRAAVEAIDDIGSRDCSPTDRSMDSGISEPIVDDTAVQFAASRSCSATSNADMASDEGFPALRMGDDTPHCADKALRKSEALLQEMAFLLDEDVSDLLGKDSRFPPSLRKRARSRLISEGCTPIAGRALEKAEQLLNDMADMDMFSEEDGSDDSSSV